MTVENLGKYEISNNNLKLIFKKETSKYIEKNYKTLSNNIGVNYKILNDTLFCTNCVKEIKLIKN